jgi:predicted RNase H-related nuclease YkuK (DUF458 family)
MHKNEIPVFRTLQDNKEMPLVPYLQENLKGGVKLYIGCDSQNRGSWTYYALVVVVHKEKKGGRVLFHKYRVPRVRNTFDRLWREVEESIALAIALEQEGIPKADYIDLDVNPDPRYKSNSVFRAALGYVESMGYKARFKPDAAAASCCADHVLH